jgi:hypothetical protein
MIETETGAKRTSEYTADGEHKFPLRYDLILKNPQMLEALAETYGEGMHKYGRDNWKKGFKESIYMQHAMAHLIAYANGDESEPHLGHAIWNLGAMLWLRKHKPELLDLTGPDPGPIQNNDRPSVDL